MVTPLDPPLSCSDLPGTLGGIGPAPEDFVVDEVPLYPMSGEGEHLFVRIRKVRLTTREALRIVARAANVPDGEIGTAGLKDKHAVTTQWMSLPARRAGDPKNWTLPPSVSVVETARHGNKLRTGHLAGNRFTIRLTGVEPDALARAEAILRRIDERGLPNFFGAQRFGRGGSSLDDALAWLSGEAGEGPRRRVPPFERKLFASVVQAEAFNRYVVRRLGRGLEGPLEGEVVRLSGTGSQFVVLDVPKEEPRWKARDILPTGPIVGPKMRAASGAPLAMEREALAELGLSEAALAALGRHGDGTRRDLLVWPEHLTVGPGEGGSIVVSMTLPAGSYATVLVRELTREPFFRDTAGTAGSGEPSLGTGSSAEPPSE